MMLTIWTAVHFSKPVIGVLLIAGVIYWIWAKPLHVREGE